MTRSLRSARFATFAYFGTNGFVMGMWVVHIPTIERHVHISHSTLGGLLLLLGGGAFLGMQFTGALIDRLGTRLTVPISAVLCAAALVLPGLAGGPWTLGGALILLGLANGFEDVAMNAHAVQVEHRYDRPIMSGFHACYSAGGLLAALVGAQALHAGWGTGATLGVVAALVVVAALAVAPGLLETPPVTVGEAPTAVRRRTPRRIWLLAVLALMLMLCEGVANDWSGVDLRDVLDASAATAALGYGSFAVAMTAGRLLADRVSGRFGPVAVVRFGAGLAAVAMAVVALAPWIPLALAGWALFGLGMSGCVPQLFSAAGHHDREAAGFNVGRVAGIGYLGMLAGPAVIGPLTDLVPLNIALFVPVVLCAVAASAAGILRPAATTEPALTPVS